MAKKFFKDDIYDHTYNDAYRKERWFKVNDIYAKDPIGCTDIVLEDPFKVTAYDSDSDAELTVIYADDIEQTMGSITADDLLCKEDINDIANKFKDPVPELVIPVGTKCNLKAYYGMKHNWLAFNCIDIAKGYYVGNLAMTRCKKCLQVIDVFPCNEKRLYEMPKSLCAYCNHQATLMTSSQWAAYKRMRVRKHFQHYIVNED